MSILKKQTPSVTPNESCSSVNPTSNSLPLEISPVKLRRVASPNTKCYKRKPRKSELCETEWSSDSKKSNVRDALNSPSYPAHFSVVDTSRDSLAEEECIKKKLYEDLGEYKLKYEEQCTKSRQLRDSLTELQVDKLELLQKLKSANEAMKHMRGLINSMEDDFKEKEKERIAEITKKHDELMLKREMEIKKIKKEAMIANALTFRKLEVLSSSDAKVKFYTGLHSYNSFNLTLESVLQHTPKALKKCSLEPWQSLLLTLMRLRLGLLFQDLAFRFNISVSTAASTFGDWLDALHQVMCPISINWPDCKTLWDTMPKEFPGVQGKSIAVIIDCFEIFTEKSSALDTREKVWSDNKQHHTAKVLIGIAPFGSIIFVSHASDRTISAESGLYEFLVPYDVMTNRGFNIYDELAMRRAKLLIPASNKGRDQLSFHDVSLTRKIANLRVYVERVMRLVCRKYRILKSIFPSKLLKTKDGEDVAQIDKIVKVACALTNISPSIVSHTDDDPLTSSGSE